MEQRAFRSQVEAFGRVLSRPVLRRVMPAMLRSTPPHLLSSVLATRTALTTPSTALGTLIGGPIVTAIGGRHTLLASAILTIALGVVVAVVPLRRGTRSLPRELISADDGSR